MGHTLNTTPTPNRFDTFDEEQDRLQDRPGRRAPLDVLGLVMQTTGYRSHHTFSEGAFGLREVSIEVAPGQRETAMVSRFYWQIRVALDLGREAPEQAIQHAKRDALKAIGVDYGVLVDEFDVAGVRRLWGRMDASGDGDA